MGNQILMMGFAFQYPCHSNAGCHFPEKGIFPLDFAQLHFLLAIIVITYPAAIVIKACNL